MMKSTVRIPDPVADAGAFVYFKYFYHMNGPQGVAARLKRNWLWQTFNIKTKKNAPQNQMKNPRNHIKDNLPFAFYIYFD